MSSDSDAECREASFSALAALLRCVGETAGKALMGEVAEDKIKMQKVRRADLYRNPLKRKETNFHTVT